MTCQTYARQLHKPQPRRKGAKPLSVPTKVRVRVRALIDRL